MRLGSFIMLLLKEVPNISSLVATLTFASMVFLPSTAVAESLKAVDLTRICKATVAATMGVNVDIIRADKIEDEISYVSYNRASDGTLWKTRCKIDGKRVIWGAIDAFGPGSGLGRWRNHPADEKIAYILGVRSVTIHQTFADGSNSSKTFDLE